MAEPVATTTAPAAGEPQGGETKPVVETTWRDKLPEKIRGEKTLSKFKDEAALAESYINLEKHAGGAVRIPGEGATKEEIAAFRSKMGVPDNPAGYGIDFKDLKAPEEFDEGKFGSFLSWAHETGFTKNQVNSILARYQLAQQEAADAAMQAGAKSAEAAYTEIKKDWGSLTDRNVALVQRGVKEFGGDEFAAMLDETGMGNDPRFLRFAHKVFSPMLEDGLIKGENLGMRASDAKAEIDRLMSSKEYFSKVASERLPVIEKIRELLSIANVE